MRISVLKLILKTTFFGVCNYPNPSTLRPPLSQDSGTGPKLSPDSDPIPPCLIRNSWIFLHYRGSGRLSRIFIGKKRFRQVPLSNGVVHGNTPFLRRPTGHQKSKVSFAALLLVGVLSNPSDLEEEKKSSDFFDGEFHLYDVNHIVKIGGFLQRAG